MLEITKSFSASENGVDVARYNEGDIVEALPPVALAHGKNIDGYTKLKDAELKAAKAELEEIAKLAAAENQE